MIIITVTIYILADIISHVKALCGFMDYVKALYGLYVLCMVGLGLRAQASFCDPSSAGYAICSRAIRMNSWVALDI